MILTLMKAKLHNATVTQADLNYQGSIAIDSGLLQESGILPFEQVHVFNVTNGSRFVTYALEAPLGSGQICVNGAAARLAAPNDRIIIVAFAQMDATEAKTHRPCVLVLGDKNRVQPR